MASENKKKLAILCGGGPAPGINSVIGAATIRALLEGYSVVGIQDGFKYIMRGDTTHARDLTIDDVSRIHFRGGSFLGIARDNPTKKEEHLHTAVATLENLGVDKLITIGGDDTAFSALTIEKAAKGKIRVVHVPKTIDNDLDLPHGIPTFGFQTARHIGVELVQSLMVDAQTTKRWYFAISMGRKAGHLALGIGKAAGATLTIIPEEFKTEKISLNLIADTLAGAIIKRMSSGREDGVAVLAEGLMERVDTSDLQNLEQVERDEHGHIRLAEINFGEIIKQRVRQRMADLGHKVTIVAKDIGYELRCADPIPFDMEYTRDLGYCAAEYILNGGNAAMVSIQNGHFVPMLFKDILDPATNKTRVRMVDIDSETYTIARRYMIRLDDLDFESNETLSRYAGITNLSADDFRRQFMHVIDSDLIHQTDNHRRHTKNGKKPSA